MYIEVKILWNFHQSLREHSMKIINFKTKKMKLLTNEQHESYENAKSVIFVKKIENKYLKGKKYCEVRDHCHCTGECGAAVNSICNFKYSVPKKGLIIFHNGSNYDYHCIIKEFTEEFKKQFTCLGENPEKHILFTVPIEKKVTRIDKNGEEITKNISDILQFTDSAKFMARALSNLVDNLSEGFHKIKSKYGDDNEKCETCGITYEAFDCFLEYANFKDDLIDRIQMFIL